MVMQRPGRVNRPTLRDVAAAAQVSVPAVSQALNDTGQLSKETRGRIKKVAQDLGYTPNRFAASLRRRRAMTIGFVSSADTNVEMQRRWASYYAIQLHHLVLAAAAEGFTVTVIPEDRPDLIAVAQVDAVFFPWIASDNPVLNEAHRRGLAVVVAEALTPDPLTITVRSGYEEATWLALQALHDSGAGRIGLLTEEPGVVGNEVGESVYRKWCAENSVDPIIERGNASHTDVESSVQRLLARKVDAIFSFYEEGPAVVTELRTLNYSLPEDIQLIALCLDDCIANERLGVSHVCVHPEQGPAQVIGSLVSLLEKGEVSHNVINLGSEYTPGTTTRAVNA